MKEKIALSFNGLYFAFFAYLTIPPLYKLYIVDGAFAKGGITAFERFTLYESFNIHYAVSILGFFCITYLLSTIFIILKRYNLLALILNYLLLFLLVFPVIFVVAPLFFENAKAEFNGATLMILLATCLTWGLAFITGRLLKSYRPAIDAK